MSKHTHAVQTELRGFVALFDDQYRRSDIAFGGYSRHDPVGLGQRNPGAVVVNVERARQVAREYHDWDLPTEAQLRDTAIAGC